MSVPHKVTGFIPDICRMLGKYALTHVLTNYLHNAEVINMNVWKKLINNSIKVYDEYELRAILTNESSIKRCRFLNSDYTPCHLWYISKLYRDLLPQCFSAVLVLCRLFSKKCNVLCQKCKLFTDEIAVHTISLSCS